MKLSFIWTETLLDLLQNPAPLAPFAFLGRDFYFAQEFQKIVDNQPTSHHLTTPWRALEKHNFWRYYLEIAPKGAAVVSGKKVWKFLVPLRKKIGFTLQAPWLPGRLILEGYFYPHGLALVATVDCHAQFTLEQAVDAAFQIAQRKDFAITWEDGRSAQLSLDQITTRCLSEMRATSRGPQCPPGIQPMRPFTVFTIVRGDGVDLTSPLSQGDSIHCALETLTSWTRIGPYNQVPNPAAACVPIKRVAPRSHILYRHRRARAVWFPEMFMDRSPGLHKLSCYHKNLVLLSMQVESLGGLVAETAKQLRNQGLSSISTQHGVCAKRAVGILSRLSSGKSTYESNSPRAQIEDNQLVEDIEDLRSKLLYDKRDPLE